VSLTLILRVRIESELKAAEAAGRERAVEYTRIKESQDAKLLSEISKVEARNAAVMIEMEGKLLAMAAKVEAEVVAKKAAEERQEAEKALLRQQAEAEQVLVKREAEEARMALEAAHIRKEAEKKEEAWWKEQCQELTEEAEITMSCDEALTLKQSLHATEVEEEAVKKAEEEANAIRQRLLLLHSPPQVIASESSHASGTRSPAGGITHNVSQPGFLSKALDEVVLSLEMSTPRLESVGASTPPRSSVTEAEASLEALLTSMDQVELAEYGE